MTMLTIFCNTLICRIYSITGRILTKFLRRDSPETAEIDEALRFQPGSCVFPRSVAQWLERRFLAGGLSRTHV